MCRFWYEHKSSFPWDKYSGVWLLGCMVVACLVFLFVLRNYLTFPEWMYCFTFPLTMYEWTSFSAFLAAFGVVIVFYFILFLKHLFIYLAAPGLNCTMGDLVPWPGIEPRPPALGVQSLNHWTTREVSAIIFYFSHSDMCVGVSHYDFNLHFSNG